MADIGRIARFRDAQLRAWRPAGPAEPPRACTRAVPARSHCCRPQPLRGSRVRSTSQDAAWADGPTTSPEDRAGVDQHFVTPLLLAYFASQRRSIFAARCLVETVLHLYSDGRSLADIQVELKLAGMQDYKQIALLPDEDRRRVRLLVDNEKDVLIAWVSLIYLTLQQLDCEWRGERPALPGDDAFVQGMRAFVGQTLALGISLEQLQAEHAASGVTGRSLPSIQLMQENARLVLLTSEIVAGSRSDAASESSACLDRARLADSLLGGGRRPKAAQALLAFLGAAQGSLFSANQLVATFFDCYRSGWTAQEVRDQLAQEEFGTGDTLFPVGSSRGSAAANAQVFGQWLSCVFMALAQVGVPHTAAQEGRPGWAWAGEPDAVAASQLAQFVAGALRAKAVEEGAGEELRSQAAEAVQSRPPAAPKPAADGAGIVVVPDDSLKETSSALALMAQLRTLAVMAADHAAAALAEQTRRRAA